MTSCKVQDKNPHADCLGRINTKDDEQTVFVNAIRIDAENSNIPVWSRRSQLYGLRSKTAEIGATWKNTQASILLGRKKQNSNQDHWRMEFLKSYGNTRLKIQIFLSEKGVCIKYNKQSLTLKLFTKCQCNAKEMPAGLNCCMTPLAQITWEKKIKGLVKVFIGLAREAA